MFPKKQTKNPPQKNNPKMNNVKSQLDFDLAYTVCL